MKLHLGSVAFWAKTQMFVSIFVGVNHLFLGRYDTALLHFMVAFWAGQYVENATKGEG